MERDRARSGRGTTRGRCLSTVALVLGLVVGAGSARTRVDPEGESNHPASSSTRAAVRRSGADPESETIELREGDALIIESGEAHTFLASSDDYLHFVIHTPCLAGDVARTEKQLVPRSRLGL